MLNERHPAAGPAGPADREAHALHRDESATQLGLNEIGRLTGGLILGDEAANATVAAAMITDN